MTSTRARWAMALGSSYPTHEWAGLLHADLAWAEQQLARGHYDDLPGKSEEVRSYLAEAREHLARIKWRAVA
jgi:hypothetical protein